MVGNVIMMVILVLALTFGGFLYMDYRSEKSKNVIIERKVNELKRRWESGCGKD